MNRLWDVTPSPLKTHLVSTCLGEMVAMADHRGLAALNFLDKSNPPEVLASKWAKRIGLDWVMAETPLWSLLNQQLNEYFAGERKEFDIPLSLSGTAFQKKVWNRLRQIPYGQTMSYSGLSEELEIKNGQRAVGKANGDNPIAILVPCHRVVRADGDLCGYAGGLWRKQHLIGLESGQPKLF